jgi:hypothetical protein
MLNVDFKNIGRLYPKKRIQNLNRDSVTERSKHIKQWKHSKHYIKKELFLKKIIQILINPNTFFLFLKLLLYEGGTLWHLQKFLQYIIVEFILSFSFILLIPIPGIISTGLIFPFICMCTQYCPHIHCPTYLPTSYPFPLVPTPQAGPILPSSSLFL